MGGMGRTINGSYAELARVPATNVVPVDDAICRGKSSPPSRNPTPPPGPACIGNLALAAGPDRG